MVGIALIVWGLLSQQRGKHLGACLSAQAWMQTESERDRDRYRGREGKKETELALMSFWIWIMCFTSR